MKENDQILSERIMFGVGGGWEGSMMDSVIWRIRGGLTGKMTPVLKDQSSPWLKSIVRLPWTFQQDLLWCSYLYCLILARLLINQFNQKPHLQYLIRFHIFSTILQVLSQFAKNIIRPVSLEPSLTPYVSS